MKVKSRVASLHFKETISGVIEVQTPLELNFTGVSLHDISNLSFFGFTIQIIFIWMYSFQMHIG